MAEADISFVHLGITIENLKNQISVFGFSIAYYGIIIGIGMLTGIWVAQNDAKEGGRIRTFIWTLHFTVLFLPLSGQDCTM